MILGVVFTVSEPQFIQMWDGDNNRAYLLGFIF